MARRALIWHLFPTYLLVIFLSLLAVVTISSTSLRSFYLEQVTLELESRAALLHSQIESLVIQRDDTTLQNLCKSLGNTSLTRITVILPSGKVIADSEEDPAAMDNHATRPEIQHAKEGITGSSIRFSNTLNQKMMYVAEPITNSGTTIGILRVAISINAIDNALSSIFRKIIYGSLLVALLAAGASWIVSRRITRPLAELRLAAEKFSHGELEHKPVIQHSMEIDALAESMSIMARELQRRMATVTHQKNELQAVLSSMVEGVLAVDIDGCIISINDTAAALFDVDSESVVGKKVSDLIRNSSFQAFIYSTLESNEPTEKEITFHLSEERTYQAHGASLSDNTEQRVGAVIVLHDITQIRRFERVRSDFVSNVSHELRTPVTSIKGFIETLIDNPSIDEDESKRFLEIISRNADQLDSLLNDLLSLSQIEQGDIPIESLLENSSMREILSQVEIMCDPKLKQRGVTLKVRCNPEITARVHSALLQQAILNLVENAIKFSDGEQEVLVEVVEENSTLSISITDHGTGISPEHIPRLFERFYRVDKARSREQGGTGLGLAIVKHIVELHGGKVTVSSTLGSGSTFTISLPN